MEYWDRGFPFSPEFQALTDEEDMEDFRSEKNVTTGMKSDEEIDKLTIDESLSDMEKACLLMATGQDVQKMFVIEHLPDLLRHQQMETLCRVLPKICDTIPSSGEEMQMVASRVLGEAVREDLIPMHVFSNSCLNVILTQLESRDPAISGAWLGTILASISVLPKEEVKRRVLTLAVSKGQLSQTVTSRKASCRILGEMAPRFDSMWLKRELLPLATTLCQDVDSQVRQLMCQQLNSLARALGREISEVSIFPEIVELLNDEENRVRVSSLKALADLVSLWSEACIRTQVVPLLKKFCESALKSDDSLLIESLAKLLGKLCHGMKAGITPDQLKWFLKFYCQLCGREYHAPPPRPMTPAIKVENLCECRKFCAYNFPAMLLWAGASSYSTDLSSSLEDLVKDESPKVRRTIACGFHEVVDILGKDCLLVAHIYQTLLKDSSVEVLSGLVTHISSVLNAFAQASNLCHETLQPGLLDFIGPLLSCDQVASTHMQWRLHCDLVTSFRCLVTCMTSDQIYSKFVPLMYKRISGNTVLPIKQAAAYTLCVYIRHIRRQDYRNTIITWMIEEYAKSSSCRRRLMFIDICNYLLELFSRSFFKANFFDVLLQLAHDPVINIRLRLCQLFPTLKSLLKLPMDRLLLQNLELTVRKLISQERDPDASHSIRVAVIEMDRIEVAMETLSRKTFFESDLSDHQKEIEEKALLLAEERDQVRLEKMVLSVAGKKLTAGKSVKSGASPREVRKVAHGVHSPAANHRSTNKSKPPPLSKTLSAPNSIIELSQHGGGSNPSSSPAHKTSRAKRQGSETKASSPATGDRPDKGGVSSVARNSSAHSYLVEGQSTKPCGTKSNTSISSSSAAAAAGKSSGGGGGVKKKLHNYGLEYSKTKKRT